MVKRFIEEDGTQAVRALLDTSIPVISRLTEVELVSAVARRRREGGLGASDFESLLGAIEEEVASLTVVEISPQVVIAARRLLVHHPLRASDAIQLAACLLLRQRVERPVRFLSFDGRLNEAAEREGLTVGFEKSAGV